MKKLLLISFVFFGAILVAGPAAAQSTPPAGAVLTYHNDHFRTGWQQQETILTNSGLTNFGLLKTVQLLDQVDAQPLVVSGITTLNSGKDTAIVVDESNNVYLIDPVSGILNNPPKNLGSPVPKPLNCGNNGNNVGINSTPVIDWASKTLFVIAYVNVNGTTPTYFVHTLDLTNLALMDKVTPVKVAASRRLTNGSTFTFNATNQRQRAGLLFVNSNVYAGFASFCDFHATPSNPTGHSSRGWLLGWTGSTLTPLGANQLDDTQGASPTSFFLDLIWMSGGGIASDELGNLIFSTGNSDGGSATSSTWDSVHFTNVQESVVKLSPNLTTILGIFSPNSTFGTFSPNTLQLDKSDSDLGSGGVVVIPQLIPGFLAATAGKDGRLFLLDRMATGANSLKFLQLSPISACWCAPSFFKGPDGVNRVVTSQGSLLHTWHINSPPSLTQEGTSSISSGQDGGFFTTVSCKGNGAFADCASGSAIIWAVSRPKFSTTTDTGVFLSAFSALVNASGSYTLLFGPTKAGDWPVAGANANIVPTVSNGKVYVASNKLLTIFAPGGTSAPLASLAPLPAQPIASLTSTFALSGILQDVNGSTLTLKTRKGKNRPIDASQAMNNGSVAAALTKGDFFTAVGSSFTPTGSLLADAIYRAKGPPTGDGWPPDKDLGQ